MRWLVNILALLVAVAVLHPFGFACRELVCSHTAPTRVVKHACCQDDPTPSEPMPCHTPADHPQDHACMSCVVTTLPVVMHVGVDVDLSLAIAPLQPEPWLVPVPRALFEATHTPVGPAPPTLLALHTMLTC